MGEPGLEVLRIALAQDAAAQLRLAALLSDDERARAGRFVRDDDRRRFVVRRGELRLALGTRLGIAPAAVRFTLGAHGKPEAAGARFSSASSGELALIAFARAEVGVDVEAIRPLPDRAALIEQVMTPRERAACAELDAEAQLRALYASWTRKEALVKCLGVGLRMPLHEIEVTTDAAEPARVLRLGDLAGDACGMQLAELSVGPGFLAAIAVTVENPT